MNISWNERKKRIAVIGLLIIMGGAIVILLFYGMDSAIAILLFYGMDSGLVVALVSSVSVVFALFYHAKQVNQSKDATYATILTQTMKDLYELYRDEEELKTKHACEAHVVRWLDCLSVVTHLYIKNKLSKDLLDFIEHDLRIARKFMIWFDEHNLGKQYDANADEIWINLKLYFDRHSIDVAKDETLPSPLKIFEDLPP